jgi:hypothetical protein
VIPPEQNGEFVARMEQVLEVYKRPHDPARPVVCMDEAPRQLIAETRLGLAPAPGRVASYDYEYERKGTCNVFMAVEPLRGTRLVKVTPTKTAQDWSVFLGEVSQHWSGAKKITLVMDNLNTHTAGSLYETLSAPRARALYERFEFVYTPKHGSWLNMAEIEINALVSQCLSRRIAQIEEMSREVSAWVRERNGVKQKINWQFTTTDARVKLRRLYPTIED